MHTYKNIYFISHWRSSFDSEVSKKYGPNEQVYLYSDLIRFYVEWFDSERSYRYWAIIHVMWKALFNNNALFIKYCHRENF